MRNISRGGSAAPWLLVAALLASCGASVDGAGRQALQAPACALRDAEGSPGRPPGVIVAHRPASSGQFLGSPSLLASSDGTLYLTHDIFGPRKPEPRQTHVFASRDAGRTWSLRAEVSGQFWSTIFEHRGALYLLGTDTGLGRVVIRRSRDGGVTWTEPLSHESGRLVAEGRHHTAPTPIVAHAGRLWASFEELVEPGDWPRSLSPYLMSVDVSADLLDASSWQRSSSLPFPADGPGAGWLESQPVVGPDGRLWVLARVDVRREHERAAVLEWDGDALRTLGFPRFPGGSKKFTVRWDPRTMRYWTLANGLDEEPAELPAAVRNRLIVASSRDLQTWTSHAVVLSDPDVEHTGFQYADFAFVDGDLLFVSRTAFAEEERPADDYHNSNWITFHRLEDYAACLRSHL